MLVSNKQELIHSHQYKNGYSDLVNNFFFYTENTPTSARIDWPNKPPTYENYKHIDDLSKSFLEDPERWYKSGPITVRCPISYFYTCDSELSKIEDELTYDRLYDIDGIKHKAVSVMKHPKGFSPQSDILHGMIRWIFDDKNKNIIGFVINKDRGNLRSYIAYCTTAGNDVDLCITLDFHKPEYVETQALRQLESEIFTEDAVDRRGIPAEIKFRGAYIGNRSSATALADFLNEMNVDYAGIIRKGPLGKERKSKNQPLPKYSLTSIQGFAYTDNKAVAGDIAKYLIRNTEVSIKTLMRIVDRRNELGAKMVNYKHQKELPMSAIQTFVKTFYYLSETPKEIGFKELDIAKQYRGSFINRSNPKKWIDEFLFYHFTEMNRDKNRFLNNLNDIVKYHN